MIASRQRVNLFDELHVYNRGAMDTHKTRGAELRFEPIHGLPREVDVAACVDADVIALRLQPFDTRHLQQHRMRAGFHYQMGLRTDDAQESVDALAAIIRLRTFDALADARHSVLKAPLAERLEQVVQRALFKGLHSVLIVRGNEHHDRPLARVQRLQHFEAVHPGHLHVQEHKLRLELPDGFHRGWPVAALAHDLRFSLRPQKCAQATPGERLVIYDQGSDSHRLTGIAIDATAP